MKTLYALATTLLLSWLGTTTVAAAPPAPPANANFASERGLVFGLRLDGQPLTRPVARQVHVDRLAPGQHWVDFSLPTPYGPPLRFRTQVWLEPGLETSYVLVLRPGFGPQLRQVGAVPVAGPAYGPNSGYPGGSYQPYNGSYSPGTSPAPNPGGYYGGQPNNAGNYPGNAPYGNAPGPNPAGGYDSPATAPAPNGGYPGGYPSNPDPNGDGYYPNAGASNYLYPLPPADVQNLAQALRNQPFDDQRLPTAKQALAQSTVRADELAELLNTMSFNRSRVDLAKYGYAHLSDPQNFYRVYDALQYPSSIREVQQALGLPQN